jgi:glycosyl transferase family 25
MQAYIINLVRSTDRRAHITGQFAKARAHHEIVNGVDGRDVDLSDTQLVDPAFANAYAVRPGVVGCSLSHLKAYQKILDDDLDSACILEDDVLLPEDFNVLTSAIARHMSGAEVVLLNFHSQGTLRITRVGAAHLPSSRLLAQVVDESQAGSTGGYLITREACARMAKIILPVRVVADDWAFFYRQGAIDRLRCVVPMPVIQSPAFRTITTSYHRPRSLYATVREAIAGSKVPIVHQALASRRRRHMQRYAIGRTEFAEDVVPRSAPGMLENGNLRAGLATYGNGETDR